MMQRWFLLEPFPNTWKWVWLMAIIVYATSMISSISLIGDIPAGLVIISLYGLAYERAIFFLKFWKCILWAISIFLILTLSTALMALIKNIESIINIGLSLSISDFVIITLMRPQHNQ